MPKTPIEIMLDGVEYKKLDTSRIKVTDLPYATHEGILKIGEMELKVYVLNDGRRVFMFEDFEKLLNIGE